MMVSGAMAVTISAARRRQRRGTAAFTGLTLILLYALAANVIEQPDGITISAVFIAGIIVISHVSRVTRATALRADRIEFDETARQFITDSIATDGALHVLSNKRQAGDVEEYAQKESAQREMNPVPGRADLPSWRWRSLTRPRSATSSRFGESGCGWARLRSQPFVDAHLSP